MSSQPRIQLRRIISKHLKMDSLVSEARAIDVVTSLVQKQQRGKLSADNQALYSDLHTNGFIADL